jgi:hypothetical protein
MIPIDNFAARTNSTTIRWLIESALLAHQNVIRIWGGGAYQTDEFYDVSWPFSNSYHQLLTSLKPSSLPKFLNRFVMSSVSWLGRKVSLPVALILCLLNPFWITSAQKFLRMSLG